ncbi:hypothetical protein D3C72_1653180 [compost metagenome]
MCLFKPNAIRVFVTNANASYKGIPKLSVNSSGAAPVPPSEPSIAIKSGNICVVCIARQISINSCLSPIHILNPTGLKSLNSFIL